MNSRTPITENMSGRPLENTYILPAKLGYFRERLGLIQILIPKDAKIKM